MTEALTLMKLGFTGIKAGYDNLMQRRRDALLEIVEGQVARGRYWAIAEDDAIAATIGIVRACDEGVARRNLELIVEAYFSAAETQTFAPDEFRRHKDSLASLSQEEIQLLGALVRIRQEYISSLEGVDFHRGDFWKQVKTSLIGTLTFPNSIDLEMYAAALSRTGWVVFMNAYGSGGYQTTPLFEKMANLVDWKEAARRAESESAIDM